MTERRLNACFGGIDETTQTFAVCTAILSYNNICQSGIGIFNFYGILQKFIVAKHFNCPPFPTATVNQAS